MYISGFILNAILIGIVLYQINKNNQPPKVYKRVKFIEDDERKITTVKPLQTTEKRIKPHNKLDLPTLEMQSPMFVGLPTRKQLQQYKSK